MSSKFLTVEAQIMMIDKQLEDQKAKQEVKGAEAEIWSG